MFKFTRKLRVLCFTFLAMLLSVPAFPQNIITVAGGGPNNVPAVVASLQGPQYIAADSHGNIYIINAFFSQVARMFRVDQNGELTIYAGNGGRGFSGDGGPAISAELSDPRGIAVDRAGNVFIADSGNQRIRRVDAATGVITTVAGNGTAGFSGDGGPATSAALNVPTGIAVDSAGNLFIFIVDVGNGSGRVRRVDAATGVITTVAGNGTPGHSGDGGPAISASLGSGGGLAVDKAGNLFIPELGHNQVRRVDAMTHIITTFAGNGFTQPGTGQGGFSGDGGPATSAELNNPMGVAVDSAGNLFIADHFNFRIRRVDATTGVITTVAGGGTTGLGDGGPATSAGFVPNDVAFDSAGDLFIADFIFERIRRVDATTQIITTVAGNGTRFSRDDGGPATSATLWEPGGLVADTEGNLFFSDGNRVSRVDAVTQVITTVAGTGGQGFSGDGGPATSAELNPGAIAIDSGGNLFITDTGRIRRVDAVTGLITTVAGTGTFGFSGDGGPATSAQFEVPGGVAVDRAGNLFITDQLRIRRVDAVTGLISTAVGTGTFGFSGDGGPATSAQFQDPRGIAFDTSGNLFIADSSGWVRRVDSATQVITTVVGFGNQGFSGDGGPATSAGIQPFGVAVDNAGNLFIADLSNSRIRRVDAVTQVITTFAGNPPPNCQFTECYDYGGDGGPATSARLAGPATVTLDRKGNLFISDSGNNRIREVVASQQDTTPPVTAASASPSANTNGWNNTNVTVTLNSTDSETGGTGVKQIQYTLSGAQSLDTQTVPASTASVTISAEGMTTLNYFGTDNAGNAEQSKALSVQIDKTPPVVSGMPASGCAFWPPNNQMISVGTITAADALSGLVPGSFQLIGSSNEPSDPSKPDVVITPNGSGGYAVQLRAARLGSGTGRVYTLQAAATDLAGNTVTSTATCTVPRDHSTAVPH